MVNILARDPVPVRSNNAPPDVDPLAERLAEQYAHLHKRADELLAAESRLPDSLTDDTVGRVTDFARQVKACVKAAQDAHRSEKSKCNVCDTWLNGMKGPLRDLASRVETLINDYLRAKEAEERQRRIAEAQRLEQEAQQLVANGLSCVDDLAIDTRLNAQALREQAERAKPADLVRTHTGLGGVATLRSTWSFEVEDMSKLDLDALRPHLPLAAIESAIRSYVKAGGRNLAGARIFQDRRTIVR